MSTTVPSVDVSSSLDDDAIYSTKRAEKLLKKAKPILDEKQKLKNRLAALYNLIDAVSPVPATIGVPNVGISANNQISGDGLPQPSDSYVDQLVLQRFFKDNFIPIFSVLTESLNNHVEKKRSSEKGQGKDTSDFLRIAIILRKLIGFIPDKIESGWESQRFRNAIQLFLAQGSHPKLRTEGVRLLLTWMNHQVPSLKSLLTATELLPDHLSVLQLYATALNLTVFDSSPTPLPSDLARSDCLGDDGIPDYQQPNDTEKHNTYKTSKIIQSSEIDTVASSTEPDSIEILQEILSNLVMMATQSCSISQGSNRLSTQNCDNTDWRTLLKTVNMSESALDKLVLNRTAFQALLVHWHCFKHCYFPKLFPSIYSKFWAISGEGFNGCPLEILQSLSNFVAKCVADSIMIGNWESLNSEHSLLSRSGKLLQTLLLSGVENRELTHEIIRQGLLSPWIYSDLGRNSIFILRTWLFSANEDRPLFLQSYPLSSCASLTSFHSTELEAVEKLSPVNAFLRRYIRYVQLLYLDKKDYVENVEQQMMLWREGLQFYRLLSVEMFHLLLSQKTWQTLMTTITDIIDHTLCRPNRFAGVASPRGAEEICDLAIETQFCIWIRSGTRSDAFWNMLKESLSKCNRWNQMYVQYIRIVTKLTKVISIRIFGIDSDQFMKEDMDTKTSQRLRTASISASRTRNSASSSPSSNKFKVQTPLAELTETTISPAKLHSEVTISLLNHKKEMESMKNDTASVESSESGILNHNQWSKQESFGKKQDGHNLKDIAKGSSSSINSLQSLENSNERIADRSMSVIPISFKIPPVPLMLQAKLNEFGNILPLSLSWTLDWCFTLWKTMLCIIGNINSISVQGNHLEVIKCLVYVSETFEKIRIIQPFEGMTMPPLFMTSPWMFEACEILNNEFAESKALAFGYLCQMMCSRHDQSLPDDSLPHFYRILAKGLSSGDRRILMAIMNNSTKFFVSLLPGNDILIPAFIKAISDMFVPGSKDLGEMSEKSRESSIQILLSIFTLPDWKRVDTGKDNFPYLPNGLKTRISVANSSIKAADYYNNFNDQQGLQVLIKDMLLSFVKLEKETRNSHLIHSVLIWAIGSISFEEMLSSLSPNSNIFEDGIKCLIDYLSFPSSDAVHSAIESLAFFAKESMLLDCVLDLQLIARVIESLVSATLAQLRSHIKTAPKYTIVSDLLYCMLHWLMIPSTDILSNSNIATIVFETLELVLKESECEVEEEPDMGNTLERQRSKIDDIVSGSTGKLATAGYKLETSKASFSDVDEELNQLKETVENITSHLLQFYNSFAPPFGPTILTSQILEQGLVEEKSSEKIVYIAANEIAVIGCTDVKNVCMNQAAYGFMNRIVSRDASGRHVWENQMFYEALVETISLCRKEINSVSWFQQSLDLEGIEVLLSETPISTILSDLYLFDKEDKLDNLLLRIGTEFQECLFDSESPLNAPNSVLTITQEDVSQIVESAESQVLQESFEISNVVNHFNLQPSYLLQENTVLDGEVVNSVSNCRLYLSHLGLFNFDSSKEGNYSPVSKSSSLSRDIRGIDKKYGREIIKVALIYVAPGQEDETNILRNHDASLEYREFVTSLGWEVDISKHMGYIGGLERNQTAGISTLYYCDHSIEMVFHDALKMPVDAHDPKQVKKKRHIGNDHVHIVWNEHFRDYRKHTIGGDFGNAQIIITPTMNDLYHISISKDAKVDYFGPLQSHALIQKTTLGPLVRNTAINAFRGSVFPGYKKKLNSHHPYSQRSTDINTLSSRHKTVNHTFENFLGIFNE